MSPVIERYLVYDSDVFGISYSLMTVFGGFGNILSLICLWKKRKIRTGKIDTLLSSLSVCDLLVSFVVYPISALSYFGLKNDFYTKFNVGLGLTFTSVSSITIIMLAAVKYIKMSRFQNFDSIISNRRLKFLITVSWSIPSAVIIPPMFVGYSTGFFVIVITTCTLISLPIFYFLIHNIYENSRQQISNTRAPPANGESSKTRNSTKKLAHRVLWLVGTYFICTSLFIPCIILYRFNLVTNDTLAHVVVTIFCSNSCLNPLLYMYTDRKLRAIAVGIFFTPKQEDKPRQNHITTSL